MTWQDDHKEQQQGKAETVIKWLTSVLEDREWFMSAVLEELPFDYCVTVNLRGRIARALPNTIDGVSIVPCHHRRTP